MPGEGNEVDVALAFMQFLAVHFWAIYRICLLVIVLDTARVAMSRWLGTLKFGSEHQIDKDSPIRPEPFYIRAAALNVAYVLVERLTVPALLGFVAIYFLYPWQWQGPEWVAWLVLSMISLLLFVGASSDLIRLIQRWGPHVGETVKLVGAILAIILALMKIAEAGLLGDLTGKLPQFVTSLGF